MKQFAEMPLKAELIDSLSKIGFVTATEVQEHAIPVVLSGKDAIVRAKTGTGKTGAFLVPIMQNLHPASERIDAIVLVPTRELAIQVSDVSQKLGHYMHFRTTTVYGGASINVQIDHLRRGVNIVVGTPGRVIDLIERGALRLENVKYLVLDEADTMLDMGFIDDIEYIMSKTPSSRQTLLFSATMPRAIVDIARRHMNPDYATVIVGKEEDLTVNTIQHTYFFASGRMKFSALFAYIEKFQPKKCIIFARTQHEADLIHRLLVNKNYNAMLLHGGLTQAKRERSLYHFKGGAQFMIATNVAARGLDITDVTDIINFDAPDDPNVYVHRVGRSARMGKEGRAFTLISYEEKGLLRAITLEANIEMKELQLNLEKYREIEIPNRGRREEFRGGERRRFPNRGGGRFGGHGGGGRGGGDHGHRPHQRSGGGGFRGGFHRRRGYSNVGRSSPS